MTDTSITSENQSSAASLPVEPRDQLSSEQNSADKAEASKSGPPVRSNLPAWERELSLGLGIGLGLLGLRKPASLSGLGLLGLGTLLAYRGWTGSCPVYRSLDIQRLDPDAPSAPPETYSSRGIHVEHAVHISKSPSELYQYWRNLENLPRFMKHLRDVKKIDEKRSHWSARAPLGATVQWDAEIIADEPDSKIAWRSVGSPDVDNSGSVTFRKGPDDEGSMVKVVIDYIPPAGRMGAWIAKLFGEEPQHQIQEDMRRFKQLMETGEVTSNANGQPRGTCSTGAASPTEAVGRV